MGTSTSDHWPWLHTAAIRPPGKGQLCWSSFAPPFGPGTAVSSVSIRVACSFLQRHVESVKSMMEELIVRRELSDNHCFYNPLYDSIGE